MTTRDDHRSWQAECAGSAKQLGWKLAGGGTIYRSTDEFVFELRIGSPRVGHQKQGSLLAKPLALDPIFWEITGNAELLRKRTAFRVNGAFTVPLFGVADVTYSADDSAATIVEQLNDAYRRIEPGLRTTEDFHSVVEAVNPPPSGQHLVTCVCWYLAVGQSDTAAQVLRDAIDAEVSGGFSFPGGSFEELALDHLGFGDDRGHHVEQIDGRFRRIFPGARWTREQRLRMDLGRMNGAKRFALAFWTLPEDADRRVVDDRWDSPTYIQCAGGPEQFVIEVRQASNDGPEHLLVGHHGNTSDRTVDVRRGDHVSTVFTRETFTREEVLDILVHYVEHDAVPEHLATRPLGPVAPD